MLSERWYQTWLNLKAPKVPQTTLVELVSAYSQPERFYHNLTHVEDCLHVFDSGKERSTCPEAVELAIWFHDAIYDPKAGENEQKSAAWASCVIVQAGLDAAIAERVERLILATRHVNSVETDEAAQILVDVDLSILGREAKTFWEYESNIRREYAWVPEDLFNQKRAEILRGFLERKHIYYSELYRSKYENQARENLKQAIAKLESSPVAT